MTIFLPAMNTEISLDRLPPGKCAIIRRVDSDDQELQRLKRLGLCVGRRVELIKGGDPLIVRVFGSRLGLSAELAACVQLELCSPVHCAFEEPSS